MAGFRTHDVFAPVPSNFTEVATSTLVGLFQYTFGVDAQLPIYIRPGHHNQQDYAAVLGSEWLLYTRFVLSYRIQVNQVRVGAVWGGCSLVVELADTELAGIMAFRDYRPFHLMSGEDLQSSNSGIELPGLAARFRITKGDTDPIAGTNVGGVIMLRGL